MRPHKKSSLLEHTFNPGLKDLPQIKFQGEHSSPSQDNPIHEQVNKNNLENQTHKTVGILTMEGYMSKEIKDISKVHLRETFNTCR